MVSVQQACSRPAATTSLSVNLQHVFDPVASYLRLHTYVTAASYLRDCDTAKGQLSAAMRLNWSMQLSPFIMGCCCVSSALCVAGNATQCWARRTVQTRDPRALIQRPRAAQQTQAPLSWLFQSQIHQAGTQPTNQRQTPQSPRLKLKAAQLAPSQLAAVASSPLPAAEREWQAHSQAALPFWQCGS